MHQQQMKLKQLRKKVTKKANKPFITNEITKAPGPIGARCFVFEVGSLSTRPCKSGQA